MIHRIMADGTGQVVSEVLLGNAQHMPEAFGTSMVGVFDALLDEERLTVLIGCVAGKDRTGFVTALILYALGVEWGQITADYFATLQFFTADRLYESMVVRLDEFPDPIISRETLHKASADARYLQASFDVITAEYGGVDEYLRIVCGLDDRRRVRLQDLLLQ